MRERTEVGSHNTERKRKKRIHRYPADKAIGIRAISKMAESKVETYRHAAHGDGMRWIKVKKKKKIKKPDRGHCRIMTSRY